MIHVQNNTLSAWSYALMETSAQLICTGVVGQTALLEHSFLEEVKWVISASLCRLACVGIEKVSQVALNSLVHSIES